MFLFCHFCNKRIKFSFSISILSTTKSIWQVGNWYTFFSFMIAYWLCRSLREDEKKFLTNFILFLLFYDILTKKSEGISNVVKILTNEMWRSMYLLGKSLCFFFCALSFQYLKFLFVKMFGEVKSSPLEDDTDRFLPS